MISPLPLFTGKTNPPLKIVPACTTMVSPSCAALIAACKSSFGPTVRIRRPFCHDSPYVPRLRAKTNPRAPITANTLSITNGFETDFVIANASAWQGSLPYKHKLIAAQPHVAARQFRQREPALATEIKHLVRRRDFVRITPNPIDDVAPLGHPTLATVIGPRIDVAAWIESEHRRSHQFQFTRNAYQHREWCAEQTRQAVVRLLDPEPARALAARVVVKCNKKLATGRDAFLRILHRSPEIAGVM